MKKFKIEYLLYIFIIISPFLDVLGFLFRQKFSDVAISPATILRPLIPLVLLIYVFFKDSKSRKYIFIGYLGLLLYDILHLVLFKDIATGISYGNLFHEAQYVINYSYMIVVLFLFLYFYKNKGLPYLKQSLFFMLLGYLFLLYVAILTGTSYSTYLEGMGYRGWFTSGNSLSTILVLLMTILLPYFFSKKKIINYITFLLLAIYLVFLVGTRTGMLGFFLNLGVYVGSLFIINLLKKKKINLKKIVLFGVLITGVILLVVFVGSSTLERRKHIEQESVGIIDVNTGEVGHTTGDTGVIVNQIKTGIVKDGYMSIAQKEAYLEMYEYANENKIQANDTRKQQLIYQLLLIKNQKNILYILFGNGYVASYGEMILEMEILAILFNFGIVGFVIFLLPFIILFVYILKRIIKNKNFNIENIMYSLAIVLAFLLSFVAGYVFFSVSCILVLIAGYILLLEENKV